MIERLFLLQSLSALHVGCGQGMGAIDQPIARERATHLPYVPGSALKGVLREQLTLPEEKWRNILFGPPSDSDALHSGALLVGDAHLLLLPVRSFHGVTAFATCPHVLRRLRRDAPAALPTRLPEPGKSQGMAVPGACVVSASRKHLCLEDLDIPVREDALVQQWAEAIGALLHPEDEEWRKELARRFVVLDDDTFVFLAETATEIRPRVRINRESGVVDDGALWYEENLPAESVLWGVAAVTRSRDRNNSVEAGKLAAMLPRAPFDVQIGGKHTVGRGVTRWSFGSEAK